MRVAPRAPTNPSRIDNPIRPWIARSRSSLSRGGSAVSSGRHDFGSAEPSGTCELITDFWAAVTAVHRLSYGVLLMIGTAWHAGIHRFGLARAFWPCMDLRPRSALDRARLA